MIKPTMSHAVDKAHLNELLVAYYEDLTNKLRDEVRQKEELLDELEDIECLGSLAKLLRQYGR